MGNQSHLDQEQKPLKDASNLGYFNLAQAIADYAEILIHIKEKFQGKDSPVIVIGGSYGGRSLALSAPILYFDDITPENGYDSVVSKDFREASKSCRL